MTYTSENSSLAQVLGTSATPGTNVSVGLMSGSRQPVDRRVVDRLIHEATDSALANDPASRVLAIRLDVFESRNLDRGIDQAPGIPVAQRSPLGNWSEVAVPMPVGMRASWSLEQIPQWLPEWKKAFSLILIDLGPINLVPSRAIGRLCESCYVLLGPDSCASHEWIMKHIAWHHQSGSVICGTVVTEFARAAA